MMFFHSLHKFLFFLPSIFNVANKGCERRFSQTRNILGKPPVFLPPPSFLTVLHGIPRQTLDRSRSHTPKHLHHNLIDSHSLSPRKQTAQSSTQKCDNNPDNYRPSTRHSSRTKAQKLAWDAEKTDVIRRHVNKHARRIVGR